MTLTVPIITAVGSTAALALWLLRRFYSKRGTQKEVIQLQEKVDALTKKISGMLSGRTHYNYKRYSSFCNKRVQLNRRIQRLRGLLGGK